MEFKETDCFLGRAILLSDGNVELTVTLDVGVRVIDFRLKNGENVFFQDEKRQITKQVGGETWYIYGGHRLWIAPEDEASYYPDNAKVEYKITESGAEFLPPKQIDGIQKKLIINFADNGEVIVTHEVANFGEPKTLSVWALTALKSGGTLKIGLPKTDAGYRPNRNVVLWSYSGLFDKRFKLSDGEIRLKSNKKNEKPFKFGIFNPDVRAEYKIKAGKTACVFSKRVVNFPEGIYPDFHCNFEGYCNHLIQELETLSSVAMLNTGERAVHVEAWRLTDD